MHYWSTITQPLNVKVYISEECLNYSSPPSKDVMPALRRKGKLSVLHNSVKENFSILCDVSQLSSAEEITAKLVKKYFSDKLKLSKYPSKHRKSFAMTAGCLVGVMGLGTNQNYIGGSCHPFAEFERPAEACLPLSVPCGYFKFSLAEENSAKSYCFREIERLQYPSKDGKPTPKRKGKFAMTAGCLVGVMGLGTNQNYIGGGVPYPLLCSQGVPGHVCPSQSLAVISNSV